MNSRSRGVRPKLGTLTSLACVGFTLFAIGGTLLTPLQHAIAQPGQARPEAPDTATPGDPDAKAGRVGALVVVGGGGTPVEVAQRCLQLAGGVHARIVILPQASRRADAGESTARFWRERGATDIEVVRFDDREVAARTIRSARLIWLPGGSQTRLRDALVAADLLDVIRECHVAGAVVGGTSAGAAILSPWMITGKSETTQIERGQTQLLTGLGLWPNVIVDQHFSQRRRCNRLLSAILERPRLIGIGIDEQTATIVQGDRFEVLGKGKVVVIDARSARVPDHGALAGEGARLSVLRSGMTFTP